MSKQNMRQTKKSKENDYLDFAKMSRLDQHYSFLPKTPEKLDQTFQSDTHTQRYFQMASTKRICRVM